MPIVKTELEWPYKPADFFEDPYHWQTAEYTLVADAGVVLVTLSTPSDPIDAGLQDRITKKVKDLFLIRQLLIHRTFELEPMRVYQHAPNGKKAISIGLDGVLAFVGAGQCDVVVRDASGAVVQDTKSERIAEHTKFIDSMMPKLARSPELMALLQSYKDAVDDPDKELAHLYDIIDALGRYYHGQHKARRKLPITKTDWSRLGELANDAPLKEGRHRGRHSKLRHATTAELNEARTIARQIITAFANQV